MKKTINLAMLLIAQTCLGHIPQIGPLNLGDQVQVSQHTLTRHYTRGIIMNAITKNPDFAGDLTSIHQFLNIPLTQTLPSYEEIVDTLKISTNTVGSIAVIEAFEKAIMRHLHYNHYICCTEGKKTNIFVTGIKYNWFYPSEWINPESWISSYNSPEIRQLMAELEQLANIATNHSIATSLRLKAKVESYRNWKANTLKTIAVLGTVGLSIAYRKNISDSVSYAKNGFVTFVTSAKDNIFSVLIAGKNGMGQGYQYCATGLQNIGSSIKNLYS